MRIQIDNFVRDMTAEEEAQYIAEHTHTDEDATESDYIEALQDLGVDVDG